MAKWQFRKSRKILPGVRMNISGKGIGFSVGGPGGRISLSPNKKRITVTQSIPGIGLRKSEVYSIDKLRKSYQNDQAKGDNPNLNFSDFKSADFQSIHDSLKTRKYKLVKRLFLTNFFSMLFIAFFINDEQSPLGYLAAINFFVIIVAMPTYFVMRSRRLKNAKEQYQIHLSQYQNENPASDE